MTEVSCALEEEWRVEVRAEEDSERTVKCFKTNTKLLFVKHCLGLLYFNLYKLQLFFFNVVRLINLSNNSSGIYLKCLACITCEMLLAISSVTENNSKR